MERERTFPSETSEDNTEISGIFRQAKTMELPKPDGESVQMDTSDLDIARVREFLSQRTSEPESGEELKTQEQRKIDRAFEKASRSVWEILEQLRPEIEAGEFETIIGDDASGRLTSLIIYRALSEIYHEKGLKEPDIKFFAGSRLLGPIKSYFKSNRIAKATANITGKALVVSELLVSGSGLIPLLRGLKKSGIEATVVATMGPKGADLEGYQLITPSHEGSSAAFAHSYAWHGVEKDHNNLYANRSTLAEPQLMRYSRDKANETAKILAEKFMSDIE